jgi:hypothetical protein
MISILINDKLSVISKKEEEKWWVVSQFVSRRKIRTM